MPEVVVEIFMVDWLVRKVDRESAFFARVADVLPDWVRYAGRRRGVPEALLADAIDAVGEFREDMLRTVDDPGAWVSSENARPRRARGRVDLVDPEALKAFIDRYNARLAA